MTIMVGGMIGYSIFTGMMTEYIRHKCNTNFNVVPRLEEKLTHSMFLISGDKPDPAYLQSELEKTNAQYNKLQTLIGCYFD